MVIFSCITISFTAKSSYSIIAKGEDELCSSKHGKGSTNHMDQAWAYSNKPRDMMAESKGREAIVSKHPKTQDVKQISSMGERYKGKYRLSLGMIS